MVKARARAARAAKRAMGIKRKPAKRTAAKRTISRARKNKTVIKAKTIKHLDVSKVHNGRRRKSNGAGLARKRRAEFVGRPASKKMAKLYAPEGSGAPSSVTLMGNLKALHLKGGHKLNFQGKPKLAHNPKTDQLYVLGKNYQVRGKHKKNPGEAESLGEITQIEYEAIKTHLGDHEPVTYYHHFGEEGGERPEALVNHEGLLLIEGGDYYITPEGIRD